MSERAAVVRYLRELAERYKAIPRSDTALQASTLFDAARDIEEGRHFDVAADLDRIAGRIVPPNEMRRREGL